MIINRAMVTEVLRTSGAVTVVILSIFMVMRVLGFLQAAAQGDISVHSILLLLLLKVVAYGDLILPLMLYIAILMVMSRWCRDNEMAVLSACGVSLFNFLRPLAVLVLIVGVLVAAFSFYLTPKANMAGWKIEMNYRRHDKLSEVVPGVFMQTRQGRGVYFVESYDKTTGRFENVFVYKSSFGKEGVVVSKYAYERTDALTGDRFLVLMNGTRYEGQPGQPDYRIVDFKTYALRIQPAVPVTGRGPVIGRSTLVIAGDPNPILVAEMQWRISKVLIVPILGLFALTFSYAPPGQSRVAGMIMAFLVYFVYTNLLGFGVAMISKGKLNPHIGLWGIHAVFLAIALILFYRRGRNLPLIPRPRLRLPRPSPRWS